MDCPQQIPHYVLIWLAEIFTIFSETTHLNDVLVGTNNICEVLHRYFSLYMDLLRKSNIGQTPSELRNLFKLKRSSINTSKTNIYIRGLGCLNATFNNISVISWWCFIGGGNRKIQRKSPPAVTHRQTLSRNVVSSTLQTHNFIGDRHWLH